ncbi:peptidase C56 [Nostoc sp. 3335mG]|jgi:protease I|nr:peptidase C56 [Nostoc sp. 3335mG]
MTDLSRSRVLMIATDGFEQSELFGPRQALLDAGAQVTLASLEIDPITGEQGGEKGKSITPDTTIDRVDAADYDALVLPGGVANPDTLRMNDRVVSIIREVFDAGKPVAAICHAPWLLIEAGVVEGRRATGWPSVRTDLGNAGATVLDEEVVVDGNLITSRKPDDIPAFSRAVIDALEHARADA